MANSALEIINDHIGGGQAKLVAYRKQYSGSGVYVAATKFTEQDERLLRSLMAARDVLDAAQFGPDDAGFREAVAHWVAFEWGGFYDRATLKRRVRLLAKPERQELLRGDLIHERGEQVPLPTVT